MDAARGPAGARPSSDTDHLSRWRTADARCHHRSEPPRHLDQQPSRRLRRAGADDGAGDRAAIVARQVRECCICRRNSRMKDVPAAVAGAPNVAATNAFADYLALTKPRLNFLVVASSAAGYYLGAPGSPDLIAMAQAVAGTALVAGGAAALNQVAERDTDAMMRRTRLRPLPDGRVSAADATAFGLTLSAGGLLLLAVRANAVAGLLALSTLVIYLLVYTPMKRRTPLSTLVGAVPGALPPLIGWAASRGTATLGGFA